MTQTVRKQGRHARLGPVDGPENPSLTAQLREKYLQPIVPFPFHAQKLNEVDFMIFGLIDRDDMEGYAAHFAAAMPWYSTQSRFLAHRAPPGSTDPLYARSRRSEPKNKEKIANIDLKKLRAKYANIARLYLTGAFKGFHPRPSSAFASPLE